jgi:divalent metal cation (Fe/Co/Zn/Cd) transporter
VRRGHEIAHEVSERLKCSSLSIQHVVVHIEPAPGESGGLHSGS